MDINSLLTSEEIFVIRSAPSRYADWLVQFVRENASNSKAFEDERTLIIETMKTWWINRNWKSFSQLMEVKTNFLKKDEAIILYIDDLLNAQKKRDTKLIAHVYFEFAYDQFHDGEVSFYRQMGLERERETLNLFKEAKNLDPTNVEIRERLILFLREKSRRELLDEIIELLQIPLHDATTFEITNPEKFYSDPKKLFQEFLDTGRLTVDDMLVDSLGGISVGTLEASKRSMLESGGVYKDMLAFLLSDDSSPYFKIGSSLLKGDQMPNVYSRSEREYYSLGDDLYRKGNLEDLEKAILAIKKSIAINPDFSEAHYLLGKISLKLSFYSKAIEEFTKATQLNPEVARYHYHLGETYYAQKKLHNALLEFENTTKLSPFFEEAYDRILEIKEFEKEELSRSLKFSANESGIVTTSEEPQSPMPSVLSSTPQKKGVNLFGSLLARLGSRRNSLTSDEVADHHDLDLYKFIKVSTLDKGKKPRYSTRTSFSFYIGKYPVTNAQYERFLNAPDFRQKSFWTDFPKFNEDCVQIGQWGNEGWDWLESKMQSGFERPIPSWWNDGVMGIAMPDNPVCNVSWYEANAYCKWLMRYWNELSESRSNPKLSPRQIRLPLDIEWSTAAGGEYPKGRFPWDLPGRQTRSAEEIDRRANVEMKVLKTTPVNSYLLGRSPFGVMDMAGNIQEWQANYRNMRDGYLSVRGGSFHTYAYCSYVSYRSTIPDRPERKDSDYGFRVVVLEN
jgi:formylglycine-generating enzyme required for sulfatase activity